MAFMMMICDATIIKPIKTMKTDKEMKFLPEKTLYVVSTPNMKH